MLQVKIYYNGVFSDILAYFFQRLLGQDIITKQNKKS